MNKHYSTGLCETKDCIYHNGKEGCQYHIIEIKDGRCIKYEVK